MLNFGTPEIINFPFGTNGKLIILGVTILTGTHIMVLSGDKTLDVYNDLNTYTPRTFRL